MSKCEIKTAGNKRCKNSLVSGKTIEVDGRSVHCCMMHYNLYKGKKNVPVFTSTPVINPIKLCCGQLASEHKGATCPDGKTMCCLCFNRFSLEDLATENGSKVDVCNECHANDNKEEEVKEDPNTPWSGHCECGACTTIGERDACYADFIAEMEAMLGGTEEIPSWMSSPCDVCGNAHPYGKCSKEKCIGCEAPVECCKNIESSAQKSREFPMHCGKCKGYHKSADDVKRCYGHVVVEDERTKLGIPFNVHFKTFEGSNGELMIDEWHSTMHYIKLRGKALGRGKVRKANNDHGYWICYAAEVK